MSDDTNTQAERLVPLSPETQDALRTMFRAAGGIFYSAPKGETAAILETKLFQLMAGFVAQADAAGAQRATLLVPGHEQALRTLVGAICPGLDTGDLLADAATAAKAMASADPIAYFGVDDEPANDGSERYQHVDAKHKADPDVFPLYRRAPTLAELSAHIAQHQVGPDAGAKATSKASASKAAPK